MSKHPTDLRALGARHLSSSALVRVLLGPRGSDADVEAAVHALSLHHRAREAALVELPQGARLLAAVELGRRAWMVNPLIGARVGGPADVAAVAAPLLIDNATVLIVALDVRGRVARLRFANGGHGEHGEHGEHRAVVVQEILLAGCRRGVVVRRVPRAAVPTADDVETAAVLRQRAAFVGVDVVDSVILGDDGFCSLLRLGLLGAPHDRRYA